MTIALNVRKFPKGLDAKRLNEERASRSGYPNEIECPTATSPVLLAGSRGDHRHVRNALSTVETSGRQRQGSVGLTSPRHKSKISTYTVGQPPLASTEHLTNGEDGALPLSSSLGLRCPHIVQVTCYCYCLPDARTSTLDVHKLFNWTSSPRRISARCPARFEPSRLPYRLPERRQACRQPVRDNAHVSGERSQKRSTGGSVERGLPCRPR